MVETNRLKLVPVTRTIWNFALNGEPNEFLIANPNWPTEDEKELYPVYLDQLDKNPELLGWGFWIMLQKQDNLIVGDIGFKGLPNEQGEVEMGYGIVEQFQNQGFATEAANALVQWAFSKDNVTKIKADCLHDNIPSMRVLEKLGMKLIGKDTELIYWELSKKD